MANPPARRRRLEIPLPSKPRDYRPGDGPALAPVCLALSNDSNAFIVDKRILPGKPIDGELKLELYYVIGWPDLPAARVSILATEILDYVSPRTLEDWEYQCSLEKDEEREKQEAAEKKKQESDKTPVASAPRTPQPKRRGRPSKAEMVARRIAQQASFGDDELANVPLPPSKTNGPSLSTPKKGLAQPMTDVVDMGETDSNEAIFKQLQGDDGKRDSDSQVSEDLEEFEGLDKPNKQETGTTFTSLGAFLPADSPRGYGEPSASRQPLPSQQDLTPYTPSAPGLLSIGSKKTIASSNRKTELTSSIPILPYSRPHKNRSRPSKPNATNPVSSVYFSETNFPEKPREMAKASVSVPPYSVSEKSAIWSGLPASSNPASNHPRDFDHSSQSQTKHIPIVLPSIRPPRLSNETLKPASKPIGPSVARKTPRKTTDGLLHVEKRVKQLEHYGFTSANRSHENRSEPEPMLPSSTSYGSHKRKRPKSEEMSEHELEEVDAEPEWEIEQIEDDNLVKVDGKLKRYFKVRWMGEWPPDENPTWEPEGNLPRSAVRKYLESKPSVSSPRKAKRTRHPLNSESPSDRELSEGETRSIKPVS